MSKAIFDVCDIMSMLPHRYPFLLLDKVIEHEPGKTLLAVKNVTYNEPFFVGHFPVLPTMPGVLIIEALAQACGVLTSLETGVRANSGMIFYFAGIEKARFKRVVVPGDQLHLHVRLDKVKSYVRRFTARAMVGDELACEAELMCALKRVPGALADAAPAVDDASGT